ncbi:hypothetical protein ACWEQL_28615 [Kitasatospora sp. NPDC004240]
MRLIESLVPQAGRVDLDGLAGVDPDRLARYAADPSHPWWRRHACVRALGGNVPPRRVPALLERVRDSGDTAEVRIALLELLADRAELLPWLRHPDRALDHAYGLGEAFLLARGRLGDLTATDGLAVLAADPWQHRQDAGGTGLRALARRHGTAAVLAGLDDTRPAHRLVRARLRERAGEDVTDALADPDRTVAYGAQQLLTDVDRLRAYIAGAPGTEAALWAAFALYRLTEDAEETRALDRVLGAPRVEVEGLDGEVRAAIVHEYGLWCERASDPRWRIEAICAAPPAPVDVAAQLDRATAALVAAGLDPAPPVPAGEHHQQGDGTYHVYELGEEEVRVSTLGRFATAWDDGHPARAALEAAGFRWIDAADGAVTVEGLAVYHFGARRPLTVDTLLFYWQD